MTTFNIHRWYSDIQVFTNFCDEISFRSWSRISFEIPDISTLLQRSYCSFFDSCFSRLTILFPKILLGPDLLKMANIIPLFKKGDRQGYNNYWPISLILNLSKLIKKLAHMRLYNFLEKHSLLFEKQYGFRAKISTNHALIDIVDKIQDICDNAHKKFNQCLTDPANQVLNNV